jgi:long-chain acyl-CoA synthetase
MSNLISALREAAEAGPDRPAIRVGGSVIRYAELLEAAARFGHRLRTEGVESSDRVALALPSGPGYAVAHYGVLLAGGVVVPLNPKHDPATIAARLTDALPRLMVLTGRTPPNARRAAEAVGIRTLDMDDAFDGNGEFDRAAVTDDDPAAVVYRHGAAEEAWGAVLSQHNLAWSAAAAAQVLGLGGDDTFAIHYPLFYPLGQTYGLGAAVAAGACLVIPETSGAESNPVDGATEATVIGTFPLLAGHLLADAARSGGASVLRTVFCSGGRSLTDRVRERLESDLGCAVLQGYGLVETSALGCAVRLGERPAPGSVGPSVPGVEAAIVDARGREARSHKAGRLLIKGPNVMSGYWRRPEETARAFSNGWLLTAEKARMDTDGNVYLMDGISWTDALRGRETGRKGLLPRLRR